MKFRTLAAAAAAVSLAAAPAVAQSNVSRDAAPVAGESEVGGSGVILGVLAAAAIIAGIIIAADGGNDEPISQ